MVSVIIPTGFGLTGTVILLLAVEPRASVTVTPVNVMESEHEVSSPVLEEVLIFIVPEINPDELILNPLVGPAVDQL
jgi:hypothetical protein